jgi:hypothetical protein
VRRFNYLNKFCKRQCIELKNDAKRFLPTPAAGVGVIKFFCLFFRKSIVWATFVDCSVT